jgi:hypothetical protein
MLVFSTAWKTIVPECVTMLAFARVRLPGQSRKWHTLFRGRSALAIEDFERVAARRDWDQDHEEDRKKRLETGSARPSGLIPDLFIPTSQAIHQESTCTVARSWLSLQADRTRQAQPPRLQKAWSHLPPKIRRGPQKSRILAFERVGGPSPLLSPAERLADLTAGRPRIQ